MCQSDRCVGRHTKVVAYIDVPPCTLVPVLGTTALTSRSISVPGIKESPIYWVAFVETPAWSVSYMVPLAGHDVNRAVGAVTTLKRYTSPGTPYAA